MKLRNKKIRIAFVKFTGLSTGGTQRWLQMMAANVDKSKFEIDYYYCDTAPYIGSDYKPLDTDTHRKKYMEDHGVNLIKFHVGAKDITKPHHPWVDTDFWDVFDGSKYDLVQTAKAGHPEYPYVEMKNKVVEYVTLTGMVDNSPNTVKTTHISHWSKDVWLRAGGNPAHAEVIYIPVEEPCTMDTFRKELGISDDAVVCGFHQRNNDNIASEIQLAAIHRLKGPRVHTVVLGGGERYRKQAQQLGMQNIHFLPHTGDQYIISKFLNTLDIYTHGRSDGETFGTVLAEAMIHGKPCISHYVKRGANAMPETIGPAGYVVHSVEEYTSILKYLITNQKLRQSLGHAGMLYSKGNYSVIQCVKRLESIWLRLLQKSERDYRPISNLNGNQNIKIGKTKLGFWYAGDSTKPSEIAYSFVTQQSIPEPFEVSVFSAFIPFISSFIDVGCNTGLYSVIAAALGGGRIKAYAIEPQKDCYDILKKTIKANRWADRLEVYQLGLAEKSGELTLHISGTGSTFLNDFNDNASLPQEVIRVQSLDRFIEENNIDYVDFIKIDVEGFELPVLKGAETTINKFKPVLFVEIADEIRGRNYRNPYYGNTLDWLRQRGYDIYRCTEDMKFLEMDKNYLYDHIAMYLCVGPYQQRAMDFLNAKIKSGDLMRLPLQLAKERLELFGITEQIKSPKRLKRLFRRVLGMKTQ
jgi:FkbM family methyltransferase